MSGRLPALTILALTTLGYTPAWSEPPKRGRVLCEGDACRDGGPWSGRRESGDSAASIEKSPKPKQARTPQKSDVKDRPTYRLSAPSNLPAYYAGVPGVGVEANEKVVFVPKSRAPRLQGLLPGDVVWAVVEQEITASPEMPTPVRAIATSGKYRGAYFVGEATLEKELKRVCLRFSKIRPGAGDAVYELKASGLSPRGSVCLEGEYVSQTGKFFIAELASAAAAGLVDSTISRSQTALGTTLPDPSLANSGKSAAVQALSKTTDGLAEQVRSAPEYTHLPGYQEIQIMIQEEPAESGN
jgi:hypothetical protein